MTYKFTQELFAPIVQMRSALSVVTRFTPFILHIYYVTLLLITYTRMGRPADLTSQNYFFFKFFRFLNINFN